MNDFENELDTTAFDDEALAGIDNLIKFLNTLPRAGVSVLNQQRVEQISFAHAMMKRVLRETNCDAKISCAPHEFEPAVGVITIEGASIDVLNFEEFARAAEFASSTEIYPLAANKVRMSFTFHGLLAPIK